MDDSSGPIALPMPETATTAVDPAQLNEWRLQALLRLTEMGSATLSEIAVYAMEEAVRLTRSEIGYIAFASEDETVLTMHAWSHSAMESCAMVEKPLVYPVAATGLWGEAVRQRRPVIINDYSAPNPLKKGLPAGHCGLVRHLNVPVFDDCRIVAVAGVGNKPSDYDASDVRQLRLLMDGMWKLIRRQQTERELAEYRQHLEDLVEARTAELRHAKERLEREIAERSQMQIRLVQSEKLASLGLLSAGVAHEINNPLAYVANNLAVLEADCTGLSALVEAVDAFRPRVEPDHPGLFDDYDRVADDIDLPYLRQNLARILNSTRQGVRRVANIVHSLGNFARLDRAAVDLFDLRESIPPALEMIQGRLDRRHITVTIQAADAPRVLCRPAQINQVVLNLLVNAMQAIESTGRGEGRITITVEPRGDDVLLEIADTGCGIPPDVQARIFDPFFTTKPVGQGTGLGLSITHSIVAEHGGRIEVESLPGQGAAFRVFLPVRGKVTDHDLPAETLSPGRG